ncbi:MAG TPA: UrcA family protein [Croceicoccus sp.]|nr:UrcA family protein [Croceicoccus sp.]
MKFVLAALASAGLVLGSGPAFADGSAVQPRTTAVDLAGYDLTDAAQVAKAEKRIRSAVRKVCAQRPAGLPAERDAQQDCRTRAEAAAMARFEARKAMPGG